MTVRIVLIFILCFGILKCLTAPTTTTSSPDLFECDEEEDVVPITFPPLDICYRVNRLLQLQKYNIDSMLYNFVGRSYDPISTKNYEVILHESFSSCRKTPDSKYHMPNNYRAELLFERRVEKTASVLEKFEDTNENTCMSMAGDGHAYMNSGSGSFSYKKTKEKMVKKNKAMFRMATHNKMYRLTGDLSSRFSVSFMRNLTMVIRALDKGNIMQAKFFVQDMLYTYGTHITIEAVVGTHSESRTYAASSSVARNVDNSNQVYAENKMQNDQGEAWVMTDEGLNLRNDSDSSSMEEFKPVILSRQIVPIYMMMEKHNLGMNQSIQEQLKYLFEEATNEYFERNTFHGCMETDSLNYDYQANYNDGTCDNGRYEIDDMISVDYNRSGKEQRLDAYNKNWIKNNDGIPKVVKGENKVTESFGSSPGGVFQKCTPLSDSNDYDRELKKINQSQPSPCTNLQVLNFVTNKLSCSDDQEEKMIISYDYVLPDVHIINESTHCFNETEYYCVDLSVNITIRDTVNLASYWCASKELESSLAFGGYFESGRPNNFVGKSSCSNDMIPVKIFHDTTLCLSKTVTLSQPELVLIYRNNTPENGCPRHTSPQLITVINDNKVYACIFKKEAYKNLKDPEILEGPYLERRFGIDNFDRSLLVITQNGTSYDPVYLDTINNNISGYVESFVNKLNNRTITVNQLNSQNDDPKLDIFSIILIAVMLLVCVVLILLICMT